MSSFWHQLLELQKSTPRMGLINVGAVNSDYCSHSDQNKNSYMLFAGNFNEDCMYSGIILNSKDCVECNYCSKSELCFDCLDIEECYNCNSSQDLKNCSDCSYCYDCIGCHDCFGSVGLRNKQFYFFNEPLDKEEYFTRLNALDQKNPQVIQFIEEKLEKLKRETPRLYSHILNSEQCIGDYIYHSKNCVECYDTHDCEDCFHIKDVFRTKDSTDMMFSDGSELCYECFSIGLGAYNINFSNFIRGGHDMEYCELMFQCHNCFGCIGLQGKSYCILNQQYSKEEYERKVAEIKKELIEEGIYGKVHLPTTYQFEDTAAYESR